MKADSQARAALGISLALGAAALWGTTGTAQTFASGDLASTWFGALRLAVASAFFFGYAWFEARLAKADSFIDAANAGSPSRSPSGSPSRSLPWPGVIGAGLCLAVYNLAFFAGVRLTGVAVGTAVALGSGPVWAGILQSVLARQVPPPAWWWGTALAVGGGTLMTMSTNSSDDETSWAGIMLCLISGLSYAAYTLLNRDLVKAARPSAVTLRTFSIAAIIAIPAAWSQSGPPVVASSDIFPIAYVGVATAGVSYLMFSHALRHISAATGVTLALAEPVMAFAMAVIVVGERPSQMAFAGLLLVVAGVLAVVRAELRVTTRNQ